MTKKENTSLKLKQTVKNYFMFMFVHINVTEIITITIIMRGPGSSVGIATAYGLDDPGIESRWGEIFRTSPDRP